MKIHRTKLLVVGALTLSARVASAQPAERQLGVEIGASYNIENGSFRAPCGCIFQNGRGIGFMGAISYDLFSLDGISIGVEPGFDEKEFTAYEEPNNSGNEIQVQMRYLTVEPYLRYRIPNTGLFFEAAPQAGYLLSNSFQHTSHPLPKPVEDVDSSMGDLRSMRYAAKVSAGYSFPLLGFEVAPMLTADIPLNNIRPDMTLNPALDPGIHGASGWRITSIYASI